MPHSFNISQLRQMLSCPTCRRDSTGIPRIIMRQTIIVLGLRRLIEGPRGLSGLYVTFDFSSIRCAWMRSQCPNSTTSLLTRVHSQVIGSIIGIIGAIGVTVSKKHSSSSMSLTESAPVRLCGIPGHLLFDVVFLD